MRQYLYILFFFLSGCSSSDPKTVFEERTGLSISDSISNIRVTDSYELLEGDFSIVFKTTKSQINSWLNNSPPWKNLKWHKGQIPPEIGIAVRFNFPEGVASVSSDNGKNTYFGDENLIKLLNDTTNYYSYVEDCCSGEKGLRFHDGRLLILQPHTRMIYYTVWDL